jgi:hypothetical protein
MDYSGPGAGVVVEIDQVGERSRLHALREGRDFHLAKWAIG